MALHTDLPIYRTGVRLLDLAVIGHEPPQHYAMVIAEDRGVDVKVQDVKDEVEAEHTAEIRARNKVQAAEPAAEAAQASAPLDPAAQARGVRGAGGKASGKAAGGKKGKAQAAPAVPKLSPEEAMLGIAAAMQGEGTGADAGPGEAEPAVGEHADGEPDGRATAPDAGAALAMLQPGDRVMVIAGGAMGTVQATVDGTDYWVKLDGKDGDHVYQRHELRHFGTAAWPFPMGAAA